MPWLEVVETTPNQSVRSAAAMRTILNVRIFSTGEHELAAQSD
jgi:hypothetical protein